ncbi:Nacht domain-containing protein [Fusarium bulbicola]|nr:Nacht domain-containing protein [Fusarium bulbicola]
MTTTQRAFEAAMLDFKDKLKGHSFYDQIIQTTSIEQVYRDIEKLQDKQAKSGRLRHLSKIEPFLARLREYSSVVETFVQAKPDILALIWGPVKLLLLWADVFKQSFDALVNALEEVGNALPDFCELAEMFASNNRLQELLVLYFRDILQFYLVSTKLFSMRRLKVVFEMFWPSHRDRIHVVVKHMASHRDLIRKEVRMEEIRRADEMRNRELHHFVQTEENNIAQEYASHRAHISPKSYDADLYRFSEAVCDGTGKWLFRDQSFQNWLAGKEKAKPILWLRGIPGAGKTLLASSVIKHTQSLKGTHTVFAFLTYLDSHISALSVLHSLIFQLASTSLSLKTILCQSDLQHLGTDFSTTATLFQTLMQTAGAVRVIIDGLDEIEPAQRSRLIKELVRLSDECEECHILLTSRAESDISRDLGGKTTDLHVDRNNAGSIQTFVNQAMTEWFREREFIPEVQAQLQGWAAPLAFRAKGMFLYAKVVLRIVHYINDIEDIKNQLEHLPLSLEDAYGRVLQQINACPDPRRRSLARSILGWVGCAPSPMTLKEIEQALLVDPKFASKLPKVQATVNVTQVCGPIIDIVDGYVQFVHFTVREYIFSTKIQNSITLAEMALDLAIRCLVYMCQDHHDPDLTEDEIDANILWGAYRLHHFSSSFWLGLITEYLTLSGSKTIPDTLVDHLRELLETRPSDHYTQSNQSKGSLHQAILGLRFQEPALVEMMKGCTDFQTSLSNSDFRINNPEQWLHTSPLSIPQISITLHERLDALANEGLPTLKSLSYHYGPSESVSLSKILICWFATLDMRKEAKIGILRAGKKIIANILALGSEDLFELWMPTLVSSFGKAGSTVKLAQAFTHTGTIATTANNPCRERMLLGIWEKFKAFDILKARDRHTVLRAIADTTCSINLARYVIQHGGEVDGKAHDNSPTALQFAARKTTQQAADLMKFLLLQGADPNMGARKSSGMAPKMIRDERGAREISKWLGVTWEELVEQTTEELQRIKREEKKCCHGV